MAARISARDAWDLIQKQGYKYLDVRSIPEFEQGHPQGAINIPLNHMSAGGGGMAANERFAEVVAANFPKDAPLVVGCQAGGRSRRACQILEGVGFTRLVDQRAGFGGSRDISGNVVEDGWQGCNLPVATSAAPGNDYESLAAKAATPG